MSPLSDRHRQRAKVLVRGVFSQGGGALAGILLIAAAPWLVRYHTIMIPASAMILAALWLLLQHRTARLYLDTLSAALGMRRLATRSVAGDTMLDRDGLAQVIGMLGDENPERAQLGREILATAVPDSAVLLIEMPRPAVRYTSSWLGRQACQGGGRCARRCSPRLPTTTRWQLA
jgi:hypothetical protein